MFVDKEEKRWAKFFGPVVMPAGFLSELRNHTNFAGLSAVDNAGDDVVRKE